MSAQACVMSHRFVLISKMNSLRLTNINVRSFKVKKGQVGRIIFFCFVHKIYVLIVSSFVATEISYYFNLMFDNFYIYCYKTIYIDEWNHNVIVQDISK